MKTASRRLKDWERNRPPQRKAPAPPAVTKKRHAILTDAEVDILCRALLTWRYTNHSMRGGSPTWETTERQDAALAIAKKLGIGRQYLDLVFDTPVVSVTVKGLE